MGIGLKATIANAPNTKMKDTSNPKVSVIMAAYNGEQYLDSAIKSILNQDFTDFEFLIVDDASTDGTATILSYYEASDKRVKLIHNESNKGLTKSLNLALRAAKGEFIARQDADDIALPERLATQVNELDQKNTAILVSAGICIIDETGVATGQIIRPYTPDETKWRLVFENAIGGHSQVMYRRNPVMKIGGYDENFRFAQDYELWTRISQLGDIVTLPQILQQWRVHSQGISTKSKTAQDELRNKITRRGIQNATGYLATDKELEQLDAFWTAKIDKLQSSLSTIDTLNRQLAEAKLNEKTILERDKIDIIIAKQHLKISRYARFSKRPILKTFIILRSAKWSPTTAFHHFLSRFNLIRR